MELAEPQPLPVVWVTSVQLKEHLGIRSDVTLTRYIRLGLPAHKVGKAYLFDLIEVDRWIQSRCITPAPDQGVA